MMRRMELQMMTSIFMSKNSDGGPIDSENKVMSKKKKLVAQWDTIQSNNIKIM